MLTSPQKVQKCNKFALNEYLFKTILQYLKLNVPCSLFKIFDQFVMTLFLFLCSDTEMQKARVASGESDQSSKVTAKSLITLVKHPETNNVYFFSNHVIKHVYEIAPIAIVKHLLRC